MGKTSNIVKSRWEAENYKKYIVRLRADTDADLIKFIEEHKADIGTTEIFRLGIEKLKNEGLN